MAQKYLLEVTTDWDFALVYKDRYYYGDITLLLDSPSELNKMTIVCGSKTYEFDFSKEQILFNPEAEFKYLGGNRNVKWTPVTLKKLNEQSQI